MVRRSLLLLMTSILAGMSSVGAHAETPEELESIVRSNICDGPNMPTYSWLKYEENCPGYGSMNASEQVRCQIETNKANSKIAEYNQFVYKCRNSYRKN